MECEEDYLKAFCVQSLSLPLSQADFQIVLHNINNINNTIIGSDSVAIHGFK